MIKFCLSMLILSWTELNLPSKNLPREINTTLIDFTLILVTA